MSEEFDALVFIGRFSPLHKGHEAVIKEALKKANYVIVLVGSAFQPRDIRNPWTFEERKQMIKSVFPGGRVIVSPLKDYPYDDNKWLAAARSTVYSSIPFLSDSTEIGLIGHNKDHTSYYLNMFPDWKSIEVDNFQSINATDIRNYIFSNPYEYNWLNTPHISGPVLDILVNIIDDHKMDNLIYEWNLIKDYRQQWEASPYPPTFVTVDAVVVQSGHVLLVKRKSAPGIGLWALPGGFLNKDETLLNGAIRELKEETKIKVPVPVLKGSIKAHKTFDDPHRSTRGRTLTTAYFIDLGGDTKLPKVTGADDAEKAVWVPFNEVDRTKLFEDHFHIIDYFTNIG
jgi:bifunctional NMN adenylyltransferase/nudix hydrolase